MTKEELIEKIDDCNKSITTISNKIKDLEESYVKEHCMFKKGEVWVNLYSGNRYVIYDISLNIDPRIQTKPEGEYMIFIRTEDNKFSTYCNGLELIKNYVKFDENREPEGKDLYVLWFKSIKEKLEMAFPDRASESLNGKRGVELDTVNNIICDCKDAMFHLKNL